MQAHEHDVESLAGEDDVRPLDVILRELMATMRTVIVFPEFGYSKERIAGT